MSDRFFKEFNDLYEWASLEGTEIGETWSYLCNIYEMGTSYGFSDHFIEEVIKEIKLQHSYGLEMLEEGLFEIE